MSKEKKLRKFKLVDRVGYLSGDDSTDVLDNYLSGGCLEGIIDCCGDLSSSDGRVTMIYKTEFKYFEEVIEVPLTKTVNVNVTIQPTKTPPTYWDGKDTNDIEVGMVVGYKGKEFPVKFTHYGQVVLFLGASRLQVVPNELLKRAQPTPRELAFTRFLSAHKSRGLDFAHDDVGSRTTLGQAFDVFWEEFLSEEGE